MKWSIQLKKHFINIFLIHRDGSILKLHCCISVCTCKGTDKVQLFFKNMTTKIFNLYCNIVCNTNCLNHYHTYSCKFVMINYSVHTEVEIHTSYFLLTVSWQWSWKLITVSRFSIYIQYQKLNYLLSTNFLQNSKELSPSHQREPFRSTIVRVHAGRQSKSSEITHTTELTEHKREKGTDNSTTTFWKT